MNRVSIIDQDGKTLAPTDLTTAMDLRAAADQARDLIRECERLAKQKNSKAPGTRQGEVPYLT